MGGRGETRVATAAASSAGDDHALAGLGEVIHQFTGGRVPHHGAHRHRQLDRRAVVAGTVAPLAVAAAPGPVFRVEAEMQQSVVVLAGDHHDVATTASVAAAGAAARHVLLPAERNTTVAAVAGFYTNLDLVDEHETKPAALRRGSLRKEPATAPARR
jgi:hypothetical protein